MAAQYCASCARRRNDLHLGHAAYQLLYSSSNVVEPLRWRSATDRDLPPYKLKLESVMKNFWIAMMAFGLAVGITSARAEETKGSEKAEAAEAAKNAPALAAALKEATVY